MNTSKRIARPLFVVAFAVATLCFAAVNGGLLAFTTATPSQGICWLGGAPDVPQTYTQDDVGQGYAKVGKGEGFTTSVALKAACTADDYDALRALYCGRNPGTHFFKNIAMYGQDGKYIPHSMDCGPDCNWYDCSEDASETSSSSSSSAPTWNGICDVRDNHTNLPSYTDDDSGKGYAKVNKGTNFTSLNAISAACTQADYDALGRTFCAQNPGGSYQREVGLFDQDDHYHSNSCGNFGCNYVPCPVASSSSAVSTFKGACVVRDSYTNLPSYNDADVGKGYAKMGKGNSFASIDDVRDRCTQDDYDALGEKFCAGNTGGSYQMQVATYDQNNKYKSTGCGDFGCEHVTCPEDASPSFEEDGEDREDTGDTGEEMTPPPAGFEEEVITNTVTNKKLPSAKYEDDVLTDIEAYKNPFPDTDLSQLIGKAAAELYRRAAIGGFPDGEFKADRPVNRAEAAKFLLLTRFGAADDAQNNGRFPDVVDGQWYTKFVITAANKKIINGYPDGTFRPADQVKTAEFLKMLSLTFGLKLNLDYGYSDVPAGSWFAPYAGIAEAYELFPGRSAKLSPDKPLSRGEVAVAIYQYLAHR